MNGKIKYFNESKGFGFITAETDYFFHISDVSCCNPEAIKQGKEVTFFPTNSHKGKQALEVSLKDVTLTDEFIQAISRK